MAFKPEVRHHGGDHARLGQSALVAPALGDHRHHLVAVDQAALLVDQDHPVGVAVERDADIRPHLADLARQSLGRGRTDLEIDVEPVG